MKHSKSKTVSKTLKREKARKSSKKATKEDQVWPPPEKIKNNEAFTIIWKPWLLIIRTEQMDAEGLGRKLLLTLPGDPRKPLRNP